MSMKEDDIMGEEDLNEILIKKSKKSCEFIETILELKDQVLDLKFIVNHLKEDILCTVETSKKTLQFTNEQEIGLLVYSLMEEFLEEKFKLINSINSLKNEKLFLIENEEVIMDELAKITHEHEKLTKTITTTESLSEIQEEIDDLECELKLTIMEGNCVINNLKKEKQEDKEIIIFLKEDQLKLREKLEQFKTDLRERVIEVEKLKGGILKTKNLLKSENEKRFKLEEEIKIKEEKIVESNRINFEVVNKKETLILEHLQSITECETKYKDLISHYNKIIEEKDHVINEQISRSKELMEINIELMELSEFVQGKEKELERRNENYRNEIEEIKLKASSQEKEIEGFKGLKCKNDALENENNLLKKEIENHLKKTEENEHLKKETEYLKKLSTAQKIELERAKETIYREKRMNSLKISDLEEQLEHLKAKGKGSDIDNDNNMSIDKYMSNAIDNDTGIDNDNYIVMGNDMGIDNDDIDTTRIETDVSDNEENKENDNNNNKLTESSKLRSNKSTDDDDPFLEAKVRLAHLEASSGAKEECLQQ